MANFSSFQLKELDNLFNVGGYTPLIANSNNEFSQFFETLGIDIYGEYDNGSKAKTLMNFWIKSSDDIALKVIREVKEIIYYEFEEDETKLNKAKKLFESIENKLSSQLNIKNGFFEKVKKYQLLKELKPGGFGDTFLIKDIYLEKQFVLKKYRGEFITKEQNQKFLEKFYDEIKILYDLNHQNIVRIYDYSNEKEAWYIMEYIDGSNIDEYIKDNPINISKIFIQAINVFSFLENKNICHRDIRIDNILVGKDGILKIIDFGFGKVIQNNGTIQNATKLINYPFSLPNELQCDKPRYNIKTEIYFVGKIFEKIINDYNIETFAYNYIISDMIKLDPNDRIESFFTIKSRIKNSTKNIEIVPSDVKQNYQNLVSNLNNIIINRLEESKLYDYDEIIENLEALKEVNIFNDKLEEVNHFAECFISDLAEFYPKRIEVSIDYIRELIKWLKGLNNEQKDKFIKSLHYKLSNYSLYAEYSF